MANEYSIKDIKSDGGPRSCPGASGYVYRKHGLEGTHHMLWEIVDNAVDEAANGYADRISVTLNNDLSVTVEDNGRGIPWNT